MNPSWSTEHGRLLNQFSVAMNRNRKGEKWHRSVECAVSPFIFARASAGKVRLTRGVDVGAGFNQVEHHFDILEGHQRWRQLQQVR